VLGKLKDEINALQDTLESKELRRDHLFEMKYLQNVLKESEWLR